MDQEDWSTSSAEAKPAWKGAAPRLSGTVKGGQAAKLESVARLGPLASMHSGKDGHHKLVPHAEAALAAPVGRGGNGPRVKSASAPKDQLGISPGGKGMLAGPSVGKAVIGARDGTAGKARAKPTETDISVIRKAFIHKLERKGLTIVRRFLQTSDPRVRADPECILAAVRKQSLLFEFSANSLKSDREFMLTVPKMKCNDIHAGHAIMLAAAVFQADEEMVDAAREAFLDAIPYNPPRLLEDVLADSPPFLQAAIRAEFPDGEFVGR